MYVCMYVCMCSGIGATRHKQDTKRNATTRVNTHAQRDRIHKADRRRSDVRLVAYAPSPCRIEARRRRTVNGLLEYAPSPCESHHGRVLGYAPSPCERCRSRVVDYGPSTCASACRGHLSEAGSNRLRAETSVSQTCICSYLTSRLLS